MSFQIARRKVGYDFDPLVIADIGINHEGSLDVAKLMVDTAVEAGIEVIKHQTHIVDDEMSGQAKEIVPRHVGKSIFDLMDDCALNEDEEKEPKC